MGIRIGTRNYLGERPVFNDYGNQIAVLCAKDMFGDIPVKSIYGDLLGTIRGGYALGEPLLVNEAGKIIGSISDTDLIKDSFGNPVAGNVVSTDMFGDTNISGSVDGLSDKAANPLRQTHASTSYAGSRLDTSSPQYGGNTADPIKRFVSDIDSVTSAMLPKSVTSSRGFIEAWVPELKEKRLQEEKERQARRDKQEYDRDPVAFLSKQVSPAASEDTLRELAEKFRTLIPRDSEARRWALKCDNMADIYQEERLSEEDRFTKASQALQPIRDKLARYQGKLCATANCTVIFDGKKVITVGKKNKDCKGGAKRLAKPGIVAIAEGWHHAVALKADGTVNEIASAYGGRLYSSWNNIIAIATGDWHTFGLKRDGTACVAGDGNWCSGVKYWKDITAIAAASNHIVGLKKDGTVVRAEQRPIWRFADTDRWRDIVAVAASNKGVFGLKADGTVVSSPAMEDDYTFHSLDSSINKWTDIVAISAGSQHVVGLKADGTVVVANDSHATKYANWRETANWRDIVAISAGGCCTVGLKSNGTLVAVGYNGDGQCEVSKIRISI